MKRKFCAIVDANSVPEVIGSDNAASQIFVEFLVQGLGIIHIRGKLRNELEANQHHMTWSSNGEVGSKMLTMGKLNGKLKT